ncbi:heavy-metal-associated domain-containing protein [Nocardia heshunensis]
MTTLVFRVEGMHCGSCAMLIDDTLEDLPGVHRASTSKRKSTTTVEVDNATVADIVAAVTALGYTAIPA